MFRSEDPGEGRHPAHPGCAGPRSRGVSRPFRALQNPRSARNTPTAGAVVLPSSGMAPRRVLVAVARAQLVAQLAGLAVALRRKRYYDVGFMRGSPESIVRDAVWSGTAYSAPAYMLAIQAWATTRLATGPADGARRMLGMLGVVMVPGYLAERDGRRHLRPGGFDPVETPVVAVSLGLAAAMAVLGHRIRRAGRPGRPRRRTRPSPSAGCRRRSRHPSCPGTSATPSPCR